MIDTMQHLFTVKYFSELKIFMALHQEFEFPALSFRPFMTLLVNREAFFKTCMSFSLSASTCRGLTTWHHGLYLLEMQNAKKSMAIKKKIALMSRLGVVRANVAHTGPQNHLLLSMYLRSIFLELWSWNLVGYL